MSRALRVVALSGSPSAASRTLRLLQDAAKRLALESVDVEVVDIRELPSDDLIHARANSPALSPIVEKLLSATGVIIGTPVYKAAYSGVLKVFLDLLPAGALADKIVLPLVSGGTAQHALALDYALRPVLVALGAESILRGLFLLDKQMPCQNARLLWTPRPSRVSHRRSPISRAFSRGRDRGPFECRTHSVCPDRLLQCPQSR